MIAGIPHVTASCAALLALAFAPGAVAQKKVAPGQEGWKRLIGLPIPAFPAGKWWNIDAAPTPENLAGSVYLLEFFLTRNEDSMRRVSKLSALHDKYAPFGFRVVALTAEAGETAYSVLANEKKVPYVFGAPVEREALDEFVAGEAPLPHSYLVDSQGRVAREGKNFPEEREIVDLLRASTVPVKDRIDYEALADVRTLFDRELYGEACKVAGRAAKSKKTPADLKAACEYVQAQVTRRFGLERLLIEETPLVRDRYVKGLVAQRMYAGLPDAKWVDEMVREWGAEDRIAEEERAWKYFERALDKEFKVDRSERDLERAIQEYERVVEKYEFSEAAAFAKERMAALR